MLANSTDHKVFTAANVMVSLIILSVFIVSSVLVVSDLGHAIQMGDGKSQEQAVIHDGNGDVHVLPLDQDDSLIVETELGSNTIVVEDGEVFMSEADCDGQDCVHQGKISSPGRQIICLPHKLWIEVTAEGSPSDEMDLSSAADTGDVEVFESDEFQDSSEDSALDDIDVFSR